jgi:hypothetical protein
MFLRQVDEPCDDLFADAELFLSGAIAESEFEMCHNEYPFRYPWKRLRGSEFQARFCSILNRNQRKHTVSREILPQQRRCRGAKQKLAPRKDGQRTGSHEVCGAKVELAPCRQQNRAGRFSLCGAKIKIAPQPTRGRTRTYPLRGAKYEIAPCLRQNRVSI